MLGIVSKSPERSWASQSKEQGGAPPGELARKQSRKGVPECVLPSPRGRQTRHKNIQLPCPPGHRLFTPTLRHETALQGTAVISNQCCAHSQSAPAARALLPSSPSKQPPSTRRLSFSCKGGRREGTHRPSHRRRAPGRTREGMPSAASPAGLSKGPASERRLGTFQDYVPCCSEAPGQPRSSQQNIPWADLDSLPGAPEL